MSFASAHFRSEEVRLMVKVEMSQDLLNIEVNRGKHSKQVHGKVCTALLAQYTEQELCIEVLARVFGFTLYFLQYSTVIG